MYGISVLPEEDNTSPGCTSQLAFLSFVEVPFPSKNQMCLDDQLDFQNCINLPMKRADAYPSCIVDINIDKENLEPLKSNDEIVGSIKSEGMINVSLFFFSAYCIDLMNHSYISVRCGLEKLGETSSSSDCLFFLIVGSLLSFLFYF